MANVVKIYLHIDKKTKYLLNKKFIHSIDLDTLIMVQDTLRDYNTISKLRLLGQIDSEDYGTFKEKNILYEVMQLIEQTERLIGMKKAKKVHFMRYLGWEM